MNLIDLAVLLLLLLGIVAGARAGFLGPVFVMLGEAAGAAIGTTMSRSIRLSPLRPLDALGGAVVGAAHVVLLVWLLGGMLAMGMAPTIGTAAQESGAIRLPTARLGPPAPAGLRR